LLRQPPPVGGTIIGPRSRGESACWLQKLLSQIPDLALRGYRLRYFRSGVGNAVRRFQKREGFEIDGVAGPKTLNSAPKCRGNTGDLQTYPRSPEHHVLYSGSIKEIPARALAGSGTGPGDANFSIEKESMRLNLWALLALILAAPAVVIALYSSLRSGPPVVTVAQTAPTTARETRNGT